ncbi:MAG: pilus assembly protein PilM [Chloroflexi bacterium]|nr:pilus assembly protein PilM [Chloroflexota bacterium]
MNKNVTKTKENARKIEEARKQAMKVASIQAKEKARQEAQNARRAKEAEKLALKAAKVQAQEKAKQNAEDARKMRAAARAERIRNLKRKLAESPAILRDKVGRLFARRVITLYFGDDSIKLVAARGRSIEKWDTVTIEPGLVSNGVITDPARVGTQIEQLFLKHSLQPKRVITGLSGLHALSRIMTLPYLPANARDEAVHRESERELPIPMEDIYLSWQVVGTTRTDMRILLIAYARNVIDALAATLREAKIKPYVMDLAPLALTGVVDKATTAVFDVREGEIDIVIMIDGVPELIRSLPLPRARSLKEQLPIIREELERTIRLYVPEKPLQGTLPIFGSGEIDSAALRTLSEELGQEIRPCSPALGCPDGLAPASYMVNMGLVARRLAPPNGVHPYININALPVTYRPASHAPQVLSIAGIVLTVGLGATGAVSLRTMAAETTELRSTLETVNQLVVQKQIDLAAQRKQVAELEGKVADVSQTRSRFAAAIDRLKGGQAIIRDDLELVTSSRPTSITLTSVKTSAPASTRTGGDVIVEGRSPDEAAINGYARTLLNSKRFSDVVIASLRDDDAPSATGDLDKLFQLILKR